MRNPLIMLAPLRLTPKAAERKEPGLGQKLTYYGAPGHKRSRPPGVCISINATPPAAASTPTRSTASMWCRGYRKSGRDHRANHLFCPPALLEQPRWKTFSSSRFLKQELARISADERAFLFFFGSGNQRNELLSKIRSVRDSTEGHSSSRPKDTSSSRMCTSGRRSFYWRILIGKVHEAWTLFRQSPVRKIYRDGLSQDKKTWSKRSRNGWGETPSYAVCATLRFTSIMMLQKLIAPSARYPTTSPGSFIYRTRSEIPFTMHRNLSCSA